MEAIHRYDDRVLPQFVGEAGGQRGLPAAGRTGNAQYSSMTGDGQRACPGE
jgi:hypothetical protein